MFVWALVKCPPRKEEIRTLRIQSSPIRILETNTENTQFQVLYEFIMAKIGSSFERLNLTLTAFSVQ